MYFRLLAFLPCNLDLMNFLPWINKDLLTYLLHLFVECPIAKSFWNKFTMWYNVTCRENIALEQNEIIYGVLKYTSSGLTLNHLIIIAKYFLYINTVQDEKRPQFTVIL